MDWCKKAGSSNDIFRVISQQPGGGGGIEPVCISEREKGHGKASAFTQKLTTGTKRQP